MTNCKFVNRIESGTVIALPATPVLRVLPAEPMQSMMIATSRNTLPATTVIGVVFVGQGMHKSLLAYHGDGATWQDKQNSPR
jgi:hypothetical protein